MQNFLKNSILVTLLLIATTITKAQSEKPTTPKTPDMLQNADYVFEGTVVDAKGYWTKLENGSDDIYTSLLVQVTNVFKGNGIKLGLTQIIVKGGWAQMPNSNMEEFHHFNPPFHGEQRLLITDKGVRGVFAGKLVPNTMGYQWDKKLENTILTEQTTAIIYCESCWDHKYFAPWAGDFGDAKTLRKSIKSFNLTTDFVDRSDIVDDSLATIQYQKELAERKEAELKMQQSQKDYKAYMDKKFPKSNQTSKKN